MTEEASESRQTAFHAIMAKTATGLRRGSRLVLGEGVRRPRRGVPSGPRGRGGLGRFAPEQVGLPRRGRRRGRAARSTRTTSSACSSDRSGTARSWTRTACWSTTARSSSTRTTTSGSARTASSTVSTSPRPRRASTSRSSTSRRSSRTSRSRARGPARRSSLLTDADLGSLGYFRFLPEQVTVGGVPVWLSRTGFSGELGYELFTSPEHAEDLWRVIEGSAPCRTGSTWWNRSGSKPAWS